MLAKNECVKRTLYLFKTTTKKQQQKLLPPNAAEREVLAKWIFYNNKYETAFEKNKLEICA